MQDAASVHGRGRPSAQDTGTSVGLDALAVQLGELARSFQQHDDPHRTLVDIVQAAVELIPGCDEGSISIVRARRHVTSEAASSDLPRIVDKLQEQTGQGPCLQAVYQQETVRVADMATEQRWPQFAAKALEAGAAGMLSFQLYVEGDNLGALNLFSRQAGVFGDESEHVGLLFAAHAAIAYSAAHQKAGPDSGGGDPAAHRPGPGHPHRASQADRRPGLRTPGEGQPTPQHQAAGHRRPPRAQRLPAWQRAHDTATACGQPGVTCLRLYARTHAQLARPPGPSHSGPALQAQRLLLKRRDLTCDRRTADGAG